MKSIKTLLRLMGAGSLIVVAANSVVACGGGKSSEITKMMNTQVKKDFGFLDQSDKSLIELYINTNTTTKEHSWKSTKLVGITADKLLVSGGGTSVKTVSADAANFLVDSLKLKADSGQGKDRIFKHSEANLIGMEVKSYAPIVTKKLDSTDYLVTGGTVVIYFQSNNKQLGDDYSLDILAKPNNGVVFSILPKTDPVLGKNFINIPGFTVGGNKSQITINQDLSQYLTKNEMKDNFNFLKLINQKNLAMIVTRINSNVSRNFVSGDSLTIRIKIGDIVFNRDYTLNL